MDLLGELLVFEWVKEQLKDSDDTFNSLSKKAVTSGLCTRNELFGYMLHLEKQEKIKSELIESKGEDNCRIWTKHYRIN